MGGMLCGFWQGYPALAQGEALESLGYALEQKGGCPSDLQVGLPGRWT